MLCRIPIWDRLGLSNNEISFTWRGIEPRTCGLHNEWSTTKLHNYLVNSMENIYISHFKFLSYRIFK